MAASRYDTPSQQGINQQGGTVATTGNATNAQTGTSNTQGNTQQDTTGSTHQVQTTQNQSRSTNMDPASLAALNALISQLLGGGTQDMANQRATRLGEVNAVQQARAGYTKEAAFNDAQGLMAQTLQQTLAQLLPGINRAAEGAGASQSSMRALLTQQAQQQAANAASAQGLNAAVQYGGITSNLSNVLANLTQPDNTVTTALLQALQTAKGAVTTTDSTGRTVTDGDTTSSTTGSTSQNTNTTQNSNATSNQVQQSTVGNPARTSANQPANNTNVDGLVYYGPQQSTMDVALTAAKGSNIPLADLLQRATGGSGNDWASGFSF